MQAGSMENLQGFACHVIVNDVQNQFEFKK